MAACGKEGSIKIWDLRSRKLLQHYDAHQGAVSCIDFDPRGDQLASTGEDGLKIWDLQQGRLMQEVSVKKPAVCCVPWPFRVSSLSAEAFSPSGHGFAAGCRDHTVVTWHSEKAPERRERRREPEPRALEPRAPEPRAPEPEPREAEVRPEPLEVTLKTMCLRALNQLLSLFFP